MKLIAKHLPVIFTLLIFGIIFGITIKPIFDPDFFWHLATGRIIWQTHEIPQTDPFIYSIPNYPYVYHSWLSYLIVYLIYILFGFWGCTILYVSAITETIYLIYRSAFSKINLIGLLLLIPLTAVLAYITNLRPQGFSLLGVAIVWFLIKDIISLKENLGSFPTFLFKKKLYLLFPLFLVWVNLHGGFSWGLFLLGLTIFTTLIIQKNLRLSLYLGLVTLICCLICLINPYTYRVFLLALQMGTNTAAFTQNIDWLPLFTTKLYTLEPTYLIIQIGFSLFMINFLLSCQNRSHKLIAVILFILSMITHRFITILSVVIFPELLKSWSQSLQLLYARILVSKSKILMFYLPILPILILSLIVYNVQITNSAYHHPEQFGYDLIENIYPTKIIDYFKTHGVPTRMLNDYNYGGYLEWYFPNIQYFVDGRVDNFFIDGKSFLEIYSPLVYAKAGWQDTFNKFQFNGVLLSKKFPLTTELRNNSEWVLTLEDNNFVFFLPNNPN